MKADRYKRDWFIFAISLVGSPLLLSVVSIFDKYIYQVLHIDAFLTWHIWLELLSIVMSFCVFFITYYTYERHFRLRTVIFSFTFLSVSLIDMFHTFSYNGMPAFLTASSIPKATNFYIISRLTMAIGLFFASVIPYERVFKTKRFFVNIASCIFSAIVLYLVTYHLDLFPPLFIEGAGLTQLKINLEYLIMVVMLISMAFFYRTYKREKDASGYNYIILSLLTGIFSEASFTLYSSVYDTYNLLGHLYKIVSYYLLFRALFVINVHKPYINLHEAERKLTQYADNLERLVAQRTAEISAANDKLVKDLDYARHIQSALLPDNFPKIPQLDFAAKYLPCEKIGGDFYNIYKIDDENVGILIGDVAGHGVSAAMVTVFINQNIHVRRVYDDGHIRILTPRQVLTNLYHVYNRMSFPDEVYTVMLYGIYNTENRVFTYCSAGMNTTPLILGKTGEVRPIEIEGLPICKLLPFANPSYENRSVQLEEGDSIIIFTDGLVEIDRNKPYQFNEHNLMEFLQGMKDAAPADIVDYLVDGYQAMLGDRKMIDDVTVLVAKING